MAVVSTFNTRGGGVVGGKGEGLLPARGASQIVLHTPQDLNSVHTTRHHCAYGPLNNFKARTRGVPTLCAGTELYRRR